MSTKSKSTSTTKATRRKAAPKAAVAAVAKAIAAIDPVVVTAEASAQTAAAPTPPVPENIPENIPDWDLAFLALYAEDAFCTARAAGLDLLRVRPDPRLAPRWTILGTLTAVDAPLRVGRHKLWPRRVFYGWYLRGPQGQRVLAIRGTQRLSEWAIDGLFAPRTAHPVAGKVPQGFWDLYASMLVDGKPLSSIAAGERITVVGHSLGAALATYVSLELAKAAERDKAAGKPAAIVRGVFVASPRPGDAEFSKAFGRGVPDHVAYVNAADVVPRVPFWFDYSPVPNVITLSSAKAGIRITGGVGGQHHVVSYAAMMNRKSLASFKPLPIDKTFMDCVRL